MEQTGLLHMRIINHKCGKQLYGQFLHLSIQEMLAVAAILQTEGHSLETAIAGMAKTGRFNMAQLFLMGLALDRHSDWIDAFTYAAWCQKV